jgi:calcium/calmodulin-dependent protein kinase I
MGACCSKGSEKKSEEVEKNQSSSTTSPPQQQQQQQQQKQPISESSNASNDKKPAEPQPKISDKKIDSSASNVSVESLYEIKEEIGRGAFSVVRKAKSLKTGELVAIKFIEKKFVDKQDLVLLGREIEIMKKIHHPNVLSLYEVFESDDMISLVMELVTGGELFYKIVERGNYSEKDAVNIVTQMTQGVKYLHDSGICHRDLKPENLLCSSDPSGKYSPFRVVIADFGLSKAFNNGEALQTSCGTPDYVAPEVITAEGSYDKSVDMWSCGVITYVLLCGFSPFLCGTQTGLFEKIIKAEYDFPNPEWENISNEAKDFIKHLLVKEPNIRYTAQQCLEHPWLNGSHGSSLALADGQISIKMSTYNQQRKTVQQ